MTAWTFGEDGKALPARHEGPRLPFPDQQPFSYLYCSIVIIGTVLYLLLLLSLATAAAAAAAASTILLVL